MSAYLAIFRAALLTLLRYRAAALAGLFTQGFWGVLRISMFLACYAGLKSGAATPLALEQVVDYVWLGQACFTLMPIRVDANVAAMMKDGTIAYELARPVDLYSWWYVRSVALRLAPVLLRGPPLVALAALLPEPWGLRAPHDLGAALCFAAGLLAALALSASLTALLSVITTITVNGDGIARLFALCSWLCSGMPPLSHPADRIAPWTAGTAQGRSGRRSEMSARVPEAMMRPAAAASVHRSVPVASAIHVAGSVSTTLGGVPLVCRGPSTTCTAPNGGTRTSTELPGAFSASSCSR